MIPTLNEVLQAQNDLDSLCADRPLVTQEIFGPNAFYGFDTVLRRYAGVTSNRPLRMIVPHAIELNHSFVWTAEFAAPLPVVMYYPAQLGAVYASAPGKIAVRGASPFLYVQDLVAQQPQPRREGTLYFLSHSTHWVTTVSQFERLAAELAELPAKFKPVNVCVYWRDYLLGHHEAFVRRGLRILCAGHMYDPQFLVRLYHLCSMHRYACSNELGSHLFYTVKAGCSYFHLAGETKYVYEAGRSEDVPRIPVDIRARFESMFGEPRDELSPEQIGLIDEYVGADHKMSPATMRELFRFCETLDRFGTAVWEGRRHWVFPRALKRAFWHEPRAAVGRALRFASRALSNGLVEKN
jgi:hypothetical protein